MAVANPVLHSVIEWWLGLLRVCTLLVLSPLLLPALVVRVIGSGATSVLLTALLLPATIAWVFIRGAIRLTWNMARFFFRLPYNIVIAPYRFLRILTKPHNMVGSELTP
ncbi:hypothetical protein HYH03_008135 [Edaphochlamys debaryana]|uniref:Uncharacterized protein n=1 Tax=Edaphochlamys debaryana TaxID=47281 RepID=A0A836BZP4_9CHLO|nr:hypothetical protein HYH03_008135 [Edaphochlamys debaryana]|eukprot:KAG2493618.1 hypothetical protein HYH03_008135 [Edaphochlamys debaryana]